MKKKLLFITIILVSLVAWFALSRRSTDSAEIKPEFYTTKRDDLMITVKESGFLNAMEEITIKNKITIKGNTTILNVIPDGSYVKAGDFLVELDSTPLEDQKTAIEDKILGQELTLNEAENNLAITQSEVESKIEDAKNAIYFAELDLKKFQSLDRQRQIDKLQSDIDEAKDQMNLSKQTYEASETLVKKGFETTGKLDQDRLNLNSKTKRLEALNAQLDILLIYDLVKEEKRFSNTLSEAQSKHSRMIKEGENRIQKAEAQVKSNQAKLDLAKEELESLVEQIALTTITSEVEGYVLYPRGNRNSRNNRPIEPGATVTRDQTLMRIPIMNDMKVDIEVAEHFISDLKLGQKTIITIDSLKDQTFAGTVSAIALLPKQENSWLGASVQKYEVVIDVDDAALPSTIKPQISASAEIILDELKNVLSVPIQAVHTVQGKQVIYVRKGGSAEYTERKITIGKMETNFIQVLDGLVEGEEVLISEPQI